MSENIDIPTRFLNNGTKDEGITITPEIARQIQGDLAGRIEAIRNSTDTLILEVNKRIEALEKLSEQARCSHSSVVMEPEGLECGWCGKRLHDAPKPTATVAEAGADDGAALESVRAIARIIVEKETGQMWHVNAARAILAAIRRGEVPGIWATRLDPEKVRNAHLEEIASLKARLAEAERSVQSSHVQQLEHRMREAESHVADERERLLADIATIDREWRRRHDELAKRLTEAGHWERHAEAAMARARKAEDESADLAKRLAEAEAVNSNLAGRSAYELDRLAAQVETLELNQVRICGERDCAQDARDKALAELAAVDAAIGTCAFMDPPDGGNPSLSEQVSRMRRALDEADAKADALRKGVEVVKDRKVTLPVPFFDWGESNGGMDRDPKDGEWFKRDEVIDAICAAGVEVGQ